MKKWILLILLPACVWAGYEALMAFDRYFPFGRMRETPAIRPYEKPQLVMESGTVPVDDSEAAYRAMEPGALRSSLLPGDRKTILEGRRIYATYCMQCHGKNHDGSGTVGQSFSPLPADLETPRVQESTDGVLFRHISYGAVNGRQPALATTLRIEDRWRVIAYIRSLGVRNQP